MQQYHGGQTQALDEIVLTIGSAPFIICTAILLLILFRVRGSGTIIQKAGIFLRSQPWQIEDSAAIAILLLFLLFSARAVTGILLNLGIISAEATVPAGILFQALLFHLPIIIIVLAAIRSRKLRLRSVLGLDIRTLPSDIKKGFIAYLASVPVIASVNMISLLSLEKLNIPNQPQFAFQVLTENHPFWVKAMLVGIATISAPVAEEMLFRAVCLPAASKRLSLGMAAIVVSILFASIHLNAYALLPLFAMAMCLSAAYAATQSIVVPIVMHSLFNAVSIAIFMLAQSIQT